MTDMRGDDMPYIRIDIPFLVGQTERQIASDLLFANEELVVGSLAENLIGTAVSELYVTMKAALSDPIQYWNILVKVRLAEGAQQANVIGVNVYYA
jgi:hypothetical protein